MFIYHFSRLIRSKILWGFLALLMVFAFVVVDSCDSSFAGSTAAGYRDGKAIEGKQLDDAIQTATILGGQSVYYVSSPSVQVFASILRGTGSNGAELSYPERQRQGWKIVAACAEAQEYGLNATASSAEAVLERLFTGMTGAFDVTRYRSFLSMNQYSVPRLFESTFANAWLPAQAMTLAVFNATGWASPMERDFALAAQFDTTVAYTATLKNTLKPEALEVPEADIKAWYDAHQQDYKLPEQRVVAYVEVPAAPFAEKLVVEDMDAMQYYDDHNEEFRGTGTNANKTLPFEEVKDKAIEKVKLQRALEQALVVANESLVAKAHVSGIDAVAKDYGEVKRVTLRQDRPFGFQNARDVIASVFEMDAEENFLNAVAGKDRAYLLRLEKVIPEHVEPLADVKARVLADARRDRLAQRLKTNGETIRNLLSAELAKGTDFEKAVAACKVDGLTASTGMTFVLNDTGKVEMPRKREVLIAAASLGAKAISEPIVSASGEDILLVYVAERRPGDALAKATAQSNMAEQLSMGAAFLATSDWLTWNLERNAPVNEAGVSVLKPESAPDDEELE